MQFDIAKDHNRLLVLLVLSDIAFIFIHILHKFSNILAFSDYLFHIEFDGGYAEFFQYTKEFWVIILLLFLAIRRSKLLYLCWSLLFLYLFLDDAFQIHETLGGPLIGSSLSDYFGRNSRFGIGFKDYGEFIVSFCFGMLFLILIGISHYRSDTDTRRASKILFVMVALLCFFGVGIDIIHEHVWIQRSHNIVRSIIGMTEDAGEMLIMSIITCFVFNLNYTKESISNFCKKG